MISKSNFLSNLISKDNKELCTFNLILISKFIFFYFQQYSKETIQKLVLGAESLVREDVLIKTPLATPRNSIIEILSSTVRKCEKMPNPKIKRVQVRNFFAFLTKKLKKLIKFFFCLFL